MLFIVPVLGNLCEYRHQLYRSIATTRWFRLHSCRREYGSVFDHVDVIGPKLSNSIE